MSAPKRFVLRLPGAARATAAGTPRKQPNIVIMLADDQGWGDVGYHRGDIATPHIDRLAREGLRLEDFHVAPLCPPTLAGPMTACTGCTRQIRYTR